MFFSRFCFDPAYEISYESLNRSLKARVPSGGYGRSGNRNIEEHGQSALKSASLPVNQTRKWNKIDVDRINALAISCSCNTFNGGFLLEYRGSVPQIGT